MRAETTWKICRIEIATDQVRAELLETYSKNRTIELRNGLALLNDGLARLEAHRQKKLCAVEYQDLVQHGRIGLLKAIERFDPKEGHAFSSFAVPYIRGEIQHFLRDHGWDIGKVPRRAIEDASKVKTTKRWAIASGRPDLSEQQVAGALGIGKQKWTQVAQLVARKAVIDLTEAVHAISNTDLEPTEYQEVRSAIARLPAPYRRVIIEHYFKGMSETAIAQQQGASVTEIEQLLTDGLTRLRTGHFANREIG